MNRNLFELLHPDLFVLDTSTSVVDEFIMTKTLQTIVAERSIDLLPYLVRHLAGDPGEVSGHDRSGALYLHATEWQGYYSAFTLLDDVRVVFVSSKSRRVTFAVLREDSQTS